MKAVRRVLPIAEALPVWDTDNESAGRGRTVFVPGAGKPRLSSAWMLQAACKDHPDPDIFFAVETLAADRASSQRSMISDEQRKAVQEALELCQDCPVRLQCAEYAKAAREPYGMWGGGLGADRLFGKRVCTGCFQELRENQYSICGRCRRQMDKRRLRDRYRSDPEYRARKIEQARASYARRKQRRLEAECQDKTA